MVDPMAQMIATNTSISPLYLLDYWLYVVSLDQLVSLVVTSVQVLGCILSCHPELGYMLILKAITVARQVEYSFGWEVGSIPESLLNRFRVWMSSSKKNQRHSWWKKRMNVWGGKKHKTNKYLWKFCINLASLLIKDLRFEERRSKI